MKFSISIIVFILLPFFNVFAQDELTPKVPTTTLEFDDSVYNFGEITEGKKVEHVFTFRDTGDEPLIISSVKGSCGCTVPQWPKEAIAPGDVASITVVFNSKNKKGPRNQKVTLVANTNPSSTFIYLKGKVNPRDRTIDGEIEEKEIETDPTSSKDCFVIFPNPTSEILKMKMNDDVIGKAAIIRIFSESSQMMAQRTVEQVEENVEFNVSHFPSGTYFANIQVGGVKAQSICFVITD